MGLLTSKLYGVLFLLVLFGSVLACLQVGQVSGQERVVVDEVLPVGSLSNTILDESFGGVGHGFTGDGLAISEVQFYFRRSSVVDAAVLVYAKIYASSGDGFGSDFPVGEPLVTSDAVSFDSLSTVLGWQSFFFDGSFVAVEGIHYFVILECVLSDGFLSLSFTRDVNGNGGRSVELDNGVWVASSNVGYSLCFIVYGMPVLPPLIEDPFTFYFRSDVYEFNSSLSGYGFDTSNTRVHLSKIDTVLSSVAYGFRVWVLRETGVLYELTNGVPVAVVSRSSDGEGFQSAIWVCPSFNTVIGRDRLLVTVYVSVDGGAFFARENFLSEALLVKQLRSSVWNFTVYTSLLSDVGSFGFGDRSFDSRVEGIGFKEALPQEVTIALAGQGDLIGASLYPYMFWSGNIFYGLALLFGVGTIYLRYKRFEPVLILCIFFGSSTLGFLIPDVAFRLFYFLILFVIAVVLWRLFK